MKSEEKEVYESIMQGGWGIISSESLKIVGNLDILKHILSLNKEKHIDVNIPDHGDDMWPEINPIDK
jgi:hypothetical protein